MMRLFYERKGFLYPFLLILLFVFASLVPSYANDKEKAEKLFKEATDHYNKAEYTEALKKHSEAIKLNPRFIEAYYGRGATYAMLGNFDQALKEFDKVLELDPSENDAYYNKAFTYEIIGQKREAIEQYELFIKHANFQTPREFVDNAKRKIKRLEYKLQKEEKARPAKKMPKE